MKLSGVAGYSAIAPSFALKPGMFVHFVVKFKLLVDFCGSRKKISLTLSYFLAIQRLFIVG